MRGTRGSGTRKYKEGGEQTTGSKHGGAGRDSSAGSGDGATPCGRGGGSWQRRLPASDARDLLHSGSGKTGDVDGGMRRRRAGRRPSRRGELGRRRGSLGRASAQRRGRLVRPAAQGPLPVTWKADDTGACRLRGKKQQRGPCRGQGRQVGAKPFRRGGGGAGRLSCGGAGAVQRGRGRRGDQGWRIAGGGTTALGIPGQQRLGNSGGGAQGPGTAAQGHSMASARRGNPGRRHVEELGPRLLGNDGAPVVGICSAGGGELGQGGGAAGS
jgi:hypothetical protein